MSEHKEAFTVMQYACKQGCHAEHIWNSRNGITPFGVRSRDGLCDMTHVNWSHDSYEPNRLPSIGDRIFVALTFERALEYRRAYVEKVWDTGEYPMKDHPVFEPLGKEDSARHLAKGDFEQWGEHGGPDLIEVTEGVREFLRGQRNRRLMPREGGSIA